MMNLDEYRTFFLVATLGLSVIAVFPTLGLVMPQGGSERFSEFWLLGPNHRTGEYPFNVMTGDVYDFSIGVGNHMGRSEYYMVNVKLRNITQSLPDVGDAMSSSLPSLFEYKFFIADAEILDVPVNIGFKDLVVEGNVLVVGDIVIDGVNIPVDVSTSLDSESNGFYFELFFELWRYDVMSDNFRSDDRFVGLWLNMTG